MTVTASGITTINPVDDDTPNDADGARGLPVRRRWARP